MRSEREFVLAGNVYQFRAWCRDNNFPPRDYRYITTAEQLKGLDNSVVHLVGQYWLNREACEYVLHLEKLERVKIYRH